MSDEPTQNEEKKQKVISLVQKRVATGIGKKEKIPFSECYRFVAKAIDRDPHSQLPRFPETFHAVEMVDGVKKVLKEVSPGLVKYVSEKALFQAIHNYTELLRPRPAFSFETKHSDACGRDWLYRTVPVKEPKAVAWLGDTELAFSRLPWSYEPDFTGEKTPLFNELFGRMDNAQALMHWIGSLFVEDSSNQQYCYIFGEGSNGKGALSRFLRKVFGLAYRSMQPPSLGNKHWTSGLLGARLVVFPDCDAHNFPSTGLFKSLTGGDPINIDPKGEPAYTVELNCKFMFLSNERPSLSSEKADMRRAIYCEVKPLPDGVEEDGGYEDRLWAEGGAFLSTCIHNYSTAYPKHGPIKTDSSVLEDWVNTVEEPFEVIIDGFFVVEPGAKCTAVELQEVIKENLSAGKEQREFRAYLTRKYKMIKKTTIRVRHDGVEKVHKGYLGVRVKSAMERHPYNRSGV